MFLALNDIYEPSAIQQLPDGRFLVVEDEKTRPLSLLAIRPDGATAHTPLALQDGDPDFTRLDDLEGIAAEAAARRNWKPSISPVTACAACPTFPRWAAIC